MHKGILKVAKFKIEFALRYNLGSHFSTPWITILKECLSKVFSMPIVRYIVRF